MRRYTQRDLNGYVLKEIPDTGDSALPFTQDALEQLGHFEDLYEDVVRQQTEIVSEMEKLRGEGKEKTARFKELLGKKMLNLHVLGLLKIYIE